jgi:hypothetical protein
MLLLETIITNINAINLDLSLNENINVNLLIILNNNL